MVCAPGPRVVVGIDDSLAGLRAVREAVALARHLCAPLHAVRVLPAPPVARVPMNPTRRELKDCADRFTRRVFATAMGTIPADLAVERIMTLGRTGRELTCYAHRDEDVLVVGADPGWLRRLFGHRTAGYCLAHATCPVLTVPPVEMGRRRSARAWRRELRRELRRADRRAGPAAR